MPERQCKHCAALNRSVHDEDPRNDSSLKSEESSHQPALGSGHQTYGFPDFGNTHVGTRQNGSVVTGNGHLEKNDKSETDEEKGGDTGPPAPVGLFHSSLGKLRLEILGLWARTGRLSLTNATRMTTDCKSSTDFMRLYSFRPLHVLGRPLPR